MRPLKLTMRAFGPFVRPQCLDFGVLGSRRLFLINGPTGAGKTTLLDALCFALYGTSSGSEREAGHMRSDHADAQTPTEVVFDFAIGTRRFRARRVPQQERAKRRGGGTTTEKQDATLWERTLAGDEAEGAVLASGWQRVTEAIEELIGFSCEQFRQVIVLPQGRFRDLLVANSTEREAILRTLFGTDLYTRIQEALKQRAEDVRKIFTDLQKERFLHLKQADLENEQAVTEALTAQAENLQHLNARVEQLKIHEQAAALALQQGERAQEKLDVLEKARKTWLALEAQTESVRGRREALHAAQRADGLKDLYRQRADQQTRVADLQKALDEEIRQRNVAEAAHHTARQILESERAKSEWRRLLQQQLDGLRGLRERVQKLAEARQQQTTVQTVLDQLRQAADEAETQAMDAQNAWTQAGLRKDELNRLALQREGLASQARQLRQYADNWQSLQNKRKQARDLEQDIAGQQTHFENLDRQYRDKQRQYTDIQERWIDRQAAILADSLVDGEPCPVCGAQQHPNPARVGGEAPGEQDVKAAREAWNTAQTEREAEKEKLSGLQRRHDILAAEMNALEKGLDDCLDVQPTEWEASLAEKSECLKQAEQAQTQLNVLTQSIQTLEAARTAAAGQASEARARQKAQEIALAAAQAKVMERAAEIPEEWRQGNNALEDAIAGKASELELAEQAWQEAQKQADTGNAALIKANAQVASKENEWRTADDDGKALCKGWNERREKAGFVDDTAYAAALLSESDRQELETGLRNFDEQLQSARTTFENAQAAAQGLESPDLEILKAAERAAREAREQEQRRLSACEAAYAALRKTKNALDELTRQLAEQERLYGLVGRLSDVANSKNDYRMSFQRFVLTALLDDVLIAASQRLRAMSRGRYQLERKRDRGDQRSLSGLDLLVEDGYTGKRRSVETLSGGESFQAALALALGLAEVVQAYAGGTRMDAIFIDEGFGSLDPEALETAINTLIDLQQGGRLVGIISHVPELKERIDVRLEVTASRSGSTARFVLP
ncbi:MAG: SMC family ATPase [Gammaproteobacteria bacterium]|nr:SMC family ATPase [Gammaproteobacteria bacterium]MCP5424832.1 SMC family ATPase [Gammaproteobacteria bacterium]MCP5458191.1 SMC family ATPase [Gammaproteobacteria bacterium]